jgi:tetratricopeptide (TPR) repeat protein
VTTFAAQEYAAAIKDLDKALALFPEYHAARFLRGRCKAALKDAAARADFEACLETDYRDQAKKELEKR